ncbi:Na+/H+ antiporter NhaC [Reichenbachiella sp. MALMAid0571]|uniref:Na+/H+ antiporter NhaC n=1 Tax=Reichenbachiella sp. MALMAid0571 TaxID=3143939 RepID=UPI0032DF4F13
MPKQKREATLLEAFIPIIFLTVLLFINVGIFGDASLDGSNQMVLILSASVAAVIALKLGYRWLEIRDGMIKTINSAMPSILILFLIGSLAGSWMLSGIVPAMIYYGLQLLNPTMFLFAACVVCSVVSLATGSSWTTSATVGIALIGIGRAMGFHDGVVAGAVLSGAYFGDKMSPLSDTTNLAPAMAGTDIFTHIRYMFLTTFPSISITLIIFLFIGFTNGTDIKLTGTQEILSAIESKFYLSPLLFVVPAVMVYMIYRKVAAIPVMFTATILGLLFALVFQRNIIEEVSGYTGAYWQVLFAGSMKALYGKIYITTNNETVNELLISKGMAGMLNTTWLIFTAMIFGGVMECSGMLKKIADSILSFAKSTGSLIASTASTCIFFNLTASDQYLAIVVPGRMYVDVYRDRKLAPENLSRTLEDSGTVTSVLVPWNSCGAFHSSVLAVSPLDFIPYCFFNIISPVMTMVYGFLNIKIKKLVEGGDQQ